MSRPLALFALAVLAPVLSLTSASLAAPASAAPRLSALIAPHRVCPAQSRLRAPIRVQERAMRCMTNFARRRAGKTPLAAAGKLRRSARLKSRDILGCDEFDHEACGRDFSFWMRRVGYLGRGCGFAAENIAFGTGSYGAVRAVFRGWIRSPGHRRNILGRSRDLGVGLRIGQLQRYRGARVWTQHFGSRC